eukprot:15469230-Alexandrium_andersonii.AAC.1
MALLCACRACHSICSPPWPPGAPPLFGALRALGPLGALEALGNAKLRQAFRARTAQAREQPQKWSPKLPRGAFCVMFRADSESADESRD